MGLNRRSFLHRLGFAWGALGILDQVVFDAVFENRVQRLAQALGETTGERFALLIGIDRYPDVPNLAGCGADVRLQKQLLVQRFGFAPENVLVLRDEAATRENIFTVFQKQLQDLLRPGDFLLVHFSGYGTRLSMSEQGEAIAALMPVDGVIGRSKVMANNAIALSTMEGFIRALEVAQGALILDTSFDGGVGNPAAYLCKRTYPKTITTPLNPSEIAMGEQLQNRLAQRQLSNRSVVQLSAADRGGGLELAVNGSAVGLFTAALVRYLLAINPLANGTEIQQFMDFQEQQLQLSAVRSLPLITIKSAAASPYGAPGVMVNVPAAGFVVGNDTGTVEMCLGGLETEILQAIAPESEFQSLQQPGHTLRLTTKGSVFGQGKGTVTTLPEGSLFQESVRVFPRNLGLKIALGNNLSRIERVDATSALAGVGVANVSGAAEWADCVFDAGYQLLSVGGQPLAGVLPGGGNEAIKSTVERLQPSFDQLLAQKWLRLLVNETSGQLPIKISLQRMKPKGTVLMEKGLPGTLGRSPNFRFVPVELGEAFVFNCINGGDRPLYLVGFAQSPKNELILLTPQRVLQLDPQATQQPAQTVEVEFIPQRPLGRWQIYWVGSDRPLGELQAQLDQLFSGLEISTVRLGKPLPLVRSLLNDLHQGEANNSEGNKETYRLSTQHWFTLSFSYEVTESH